MESHSNCVQRIAAGDQEALEELIGRMRVRVRSVFHRFGVAVDNGHTFDDLAQEVWILVWSKANTFILGSSESAWVCAIARNVAIDFLRKRNRRAKLVGCDALPEVAVVDDHDSKEAAEEILTIAHKRCSKIFVDVLTEVLSGCDRNEAMGRLGIEAEATWRWRLGMARNIIKESPEFSIAFAH